MKSIIKNIILYLIIINIVFLNTGLEVIDASADYEYKISQQSLDEFKNKMLNMPMIGDVTIDFLQESIFYSETIKNVSNEFIKVTNKSKIVINMNSQGVSSLNYRTIQTLACGKLLLSDDRLELDLFDNLIPVYKDIDSLKQLINYYLNSRQEYDLITKK